MAAPSAHPAVPASGAPLNADVTAEDRAHERVPLEVRVDLVSNSNFYVGFSENISEGGIFVETAAPFKQGETLWMELSLFGEEPVLVQGEVAWVREEDRTTGLPPGMGMRFVDPPPELIARIQAYIEERRREPLFFEF